MAPSSSYSPSLIIIIIIFSLSFLFFFFLSLIYIYYTFLSFFLVSRLFSFSFFFFSFLKNNFFFSFFFTILPCMIDPRRRGSPVSSLVWWIDRKERKTASNCPKHKKLLRLQITNEITDFRWWFDRGEGGRTLQLEQHCRHYSYIRKSFERASYIYFYRGYSLSFLLIRLPPTQSIPIHSPWSYEQARL